MTIPGHDRIVMDPNILVGKPTIKGTRISVELILECLSAGWSYEDIMSSYPTLKTGDIAAALNYARAVIAKKRARQIAA